ncbi:SRPBCC family protein [Nitrosopumilus sp. b3]|uniref:type II toxin-antitoxin system RatA family toxin n=1 Tax=Nitrosopumilus sp. b3 TaxID=2109909 RepID=UPI002106366E|nr:SRPBCC family protein [Nitrosopumilus sp. b3]
MANAIGTGVTVPDFRHVAHHSLHSMQLESNIFNAAGMILYMATIDVKVEINATPEKVWEIVSDIDNEPKFWKGTKEVKNLSKEGDTIKREITIAFRDQKCLQDVKLEPKKRIEAKFTKGIINGEKIVSIIPNEDKTILRTVWDIKLTGMMGVFTGMIKNHIKSGTEQAMQSIKEEIER